jgi:RNA polymerase sigma factor (sigma-70 family)
MRSPNAQQFTATTSDSELVAACLAGDRNAFGGIVERYQRLLCSLAYSATGSVSESEDVAQEAFLTAWQQLADLREPDKLRAWLCGILRFKVSRLRRRDGREPVRHAEALESASELITAEEPAMDQAIHKEEQEILWSELARVPELYREPLVLYYREHRSVEHVAAALDLTEEAVKQRLVRGRKILQERVLAFVESALARSTPGRVFTLGVLAALPEIAAPAKAAGIGAAAAHGSMVAKSTSLAALIVSLSGVLNFVLSLRAALDQSRTPRERRAVVTSVIAWFTGSLAFLLAIYGLRAASFQWWEQRVIFALSSQLLVLVAIVSSPFAMLKMLRQFRRMRTEERRLHPEAFSHSRDQISSPVGEYKSRARFLGVPLVHVRFALADEGAPPVFGWAAGGDRAFGLVFAWGTLAIAPISVGAISVGVFSVGALSVGLIGLGTLGVGWLAMGCAAVGVKAYAWISALGWQTATSNGFGIARIAAEAPVALAQHANDPIARAILANPHAERNQMIFFIVIVLFSILPLIYYVGEVRRRLGGSGTDGGVG